jgi:OOP family OmpA-OmpF porin
VSVLGRSRPIAIAACAALLLCSPGAAHAQFAEQLHMRGSLGAGTMLGGDQTATLHYDRVAMLGDIRLGYGVLPWLDLHAGFVGGGFLASASTATGALMATTVGGLVHTMAHGLQPFAMLDVGAGVTGELVRPVLRFGLGVDVPLSRAFALGPVLGYGQVFQWDKDYYSSDARYVWAGIGFVYRPFLAPEPAPAPHRWLRLMPQPAPPPPASAQPVAPSSELLELIEQTMPEPESDRVELLAPVLFRFDSDELEPIGVAMLHEVARLLAQRGDIELLAIHGYADSRGSAEYNQKLSLRRATRVREWLIAHGVAEERLEVAPEGATHFVEAGTTESEHEQNRRVVFRVLKLKKKDPEQQKQPEKEREKEPAPKEEEPAPSQEQPATQDEAQQKEPVP